MITGIAHINLVVPPGTQDAANAFFADTLGLQVSPVPAAQRDSLAWFNIVPEGTKAAEGLPAPQQVHIAFRTEPAAHLSSRHPCFQVGTREALLELQKRIFDHFKKGGEGAPKECDEPGKVNSGAQGAEYPTRFFARDYAGNRLEFSL